MRNSCAALDSGRSVNFLGRPARPMTKLAANKKGQKVSVVLDSRRQERLIEAAEEPEAIRAYDSAKESRETSIP